MEREEARDNVLASIDSALTVFGDSVRVVVYYELEKFFGVSRNDVLLNPEKFDETINKIFGAGAPVLRQAILRKLQESSKIKNLDRKGLASAIRTAYHEQLERLI